VRILYNDLMIDSLLVTSSERSGFPASNVQHPHLTRVWRSVNSTSQTITVNAGTGNTITATSAVMAAHNLSSSATARVQGNTIDTWTAPPLDVEFAPTDALSLAYFPPAAYQYWRFPFDDAANPDGYIEIGRLMLCLYWQSVEETDRGTEDGIEDTTRTTESETGQGFGDLGVQKQTYAISFGTMRPETRTSLKAIYASSGQHMPIVVVPNENALDKLPPIYCTMRKTMKFTGAGGWLWKHDGLEFVQTF
jgi:hypothetical protein